MFDVELKSNKLKQYVLAILGKKPEEQLTDKDLKEISTLKLNKDVIKDLSMGDLIFFSNLKSLSMIGVNIGDHEIDMVNKLHNIKCLSISNSTIKLDQSKCLNINIEHLIFSNCTGLDIKQFNENKKITNLSVINCKDANLKGISELKNLKEANLGQNEDLTDEDIQELWSIDNLEKVNLDGDKNISDVKHERINISHETEYTPMERNEWNVETYNRRITTLGQIINFPSNSIETLEETEISVTAADLELLKSEKGQETISILSKHNKISLNLNTTADLSLEEIEKLNDICNFDKVHVNTGWTVTQDKGYNFETYKAIKTEMTKMTSDIDSNSSDVKRYMAFRKKVVDNIKYDYAALKATQNDKDYYASRNLENALLSHTCVCAGYSDLMKNGLSELGIEARYVEGMTDKGELHAWIQVKLRGDDGQYHWYNDDVTWDAVGQNKFNNCLIDDKEFSKKHKPILDRTEEGKVASCTAVAPAAVRAQRNGKKTTVYKSPEEDR